MNKDTPYILVHGSGLGGWCWDRVKVILEKHNKKVYTPTIPNISESLLSDIKYISDFIKDEDLKNCILVGHSYGGMIITGVTNRLKNRIKRVIFLDAAVPKDKDDFASHIPDISEDIAEKRRQAFRSLSKDGLHIMPPAPELAGIIVQEDIDWVKSLSRPYPLRTWLDPITLKNGGIEGVEKTYILATKPPTDIMGYPIHGLHAKKSNDWAYHEIECGHAAMIIKPDKVAEFILE